MHQFFYIRSMITLDPKEISTGKTYGYLTSAIAPRPIALASTIDADGRPNLAPFSFFNVFSANPPTLILSPVLNADGSKKDTLANVEQIKELVVNVVNFDMCQQVSHASEQFPHGVNEFEEVGFTMLDSEVVAPYRVAESPAQFECTVKQILPLGTGNISGNLIVCEVVRMHFSEEVLTEKGRVDHHKIDLVARAGGNYYSRMRDGFFEVERPK